MADKINNKIMIISFDQNFIVDVSRLKRHLLCGYGYFTSILDPLNYSGDTIQQKIVLKNKYKIRWIRQWIIDNDVILISKYADYYKYPFIHTHYHKTPSTSPATSEQEDDCDAICL